MADRETTPTASVSNAAKYRGAVVEDLQLPPAFCVPQDAPLSLALEKAYEREFDQLPVLNDNRKPVGYLNVQAMKRKFESGQAAEADPISSHTTHFPMTSKAHPYTVITPDTTLEDLEAFFNSQGVEFALVTDDDRKWVLAVATRSDLETFVKRRGTA
ncbi:uncharacterized protein EHS24_009681 [Apiotrichum porosum]|uniref:CBS domain-containing protein n=1 Tax=Apiotrichum porosum TaxID=105984 RepID=A0A427XMB9_9TREE|nr:uncharacterized protein EHS24_009681 [Apiotrichum porosum]RSH80010.1 hypothetical protein EHS24_009681 [Apiotrichum porosum]